MEINTLAFDYQIELPTAFNFKFDLSDYDLKMAILSNSRLRVIDVVSGSILSEVDQVVSDKATVFFNSSNSLIVVDEKQIITWVMEDDLGLFVNNIQRIDIGSVKASHRNESFLTHDREFDTLSVYRSSNLHQPILLEESQDTKMCVLDDLGLRAMALDQNQGIHIWSTETGAKLKTINLILYDHITSLLFSTFDENILILTTLWRGIYIVDIKSGAISDTLDVSMYYPATKSIAPPKLTFCTNGRNDLVIFCGGLNPLGKIWAYDIGNRQLIAENYVEGVPYFLRAINEKNHLAVEIDNSHFNFYHINRIANS
ncbi:MAG: hypothetical protein RLP44_07625 [Aggregatilineales bacterium]